MDLKALVIILLMIPYICSFMESLMSNHISENKYQQMLQYEHHQGTYRNSLFHGITLYELQLKKRAQID